MSLHFHRILIYCLLIGDLQAQYVKSQHSANFEVASVRPSGAITANRQTTRNWGDAGGHVRLEHIPLRYLIQQVFTVDPKTIVGGPEWIDSEFFDISANAPKGTTQGAFNEMYRKLLGERFHLKFHFDVRSQSAYALTIRPGGPHLKKAKAANEADSAATVHVVGSGNNQVTSGTGNGAYGPFRLTIRNGRQYSEFSRINMDQFAQFLGNHTSGRPVANKTNLPDSYDIDFEMYPSTQLGSVGPVEAETMDPTIPTQDLFLDSIHKLGLNLIREKVERRRFVVDRIQRPLPE